jgi:CheY-like chemotaxis protein/DNA-binding XRE family transcriptional regulator
MNDIPSDQSRSGVYSNSLDGVPKVKDSSDDLPLLQLCQRIRLQRRAAGLSLQSFGDAIGLSVADLEKIERDETTPSVMTLPRIAAALGKTLEWFYGPVVRRVSECENGESGMVPTDVLHVYTEQLRWLQTAKRTEQTEPGLMARTSLADKPGRVLLVDDTPDVLVSIGAFLEGAGLEVTKASSGDEALRIAMFGETFDVVITDHAMPGLSGVELLLQLTGLRSNLPGIIITAYPESVSLEGLPEQTVLLRKPFRRAILTKKVFELIHKSAMTEVES